jgi:hypothetical protein
VNELLMSGSDPAVFSVSSILVKHHHLFITSSDRLPVNWSESPTGYSAAGVRPAEPAPASSAAPVCTSAAQSGIIDAESTCPHFFCLAAG